jgi:5'-phosphate synthase pdxT subunit
MRIGVLAIQGDFDLHLQKLRSLGIECIPVRNPRQLAECDALIMPGGESTTFLKLLKEINLYHAIKSFGESKYVFGTCAGLVMLSHKIINFPMDSLDLIDIDVERNAYGRQYESFVDTIELTLNNQSSSYEGVFIRAPKITRVGDRVKILAYHKTDVVMIENDHILASTFHPELTTDPHIHSYFIQKIQPK